MFARIKQFHSRWYAHLDGIRVAVAFVFAALSNIFLIPDRMKNVLVGTDEPSYAATVLKSVVFWCQDGHVWEVPNYVTDDGAGLSLHLERVCPSPTCQLADVNDFARALGVDLDSPEYEHISHRTVLSDETRRLWQEQFYIVGSSLVHRDVVRAREVGALSFDLNAEVLL